MRPSPRAHDLPPTCNSNRYQANASSATPASVAALRMHQLPPHLGKAKVKSKHGPITAFTFTSVS